MRSEKIKSSTALYFISGLLFICGIGLFVFLLVKGITSTVDKMNIQVVVPGTEVVELKKPGKYTIFLEYGSVINGKIYETRNISGLMCSLYNRSTSEYIEIKKDKSNSNYSIGGRQGRSIYNFKIDKPGKYEIKGWYENNSTDEVVLSIGKGFVGSLVFTILSSSVILFITIGTSVGILIYALKRTKDNDLLETSVYHN